MATCALRGPIISICFLAVYFNSSIAEENVLTRTLKASEDFIHQVGQPGDRGWALDYKRHRPGYALTGPKEPLLLEPHSTRCTFVLRRGHYPQKGFLHHTYGIFRLEIWDATTQEKITSRHLQMSDFPAPNVYVKRWLEFSMEGRQGHVIEPRVYWLGLANAEIAAIEIQQYPDVSLKNLEEKAWRLGQLMERQFLENGFVVSRNLDGSPDETGDATTYTGYYVASLAWKYAVTKDELTYQALENGLQTLHKAVKGTEDAPLITRFVDAQGNAFPKSPSKDVYTSFFLAASAAMPYLRNEPLKRQIREEAIRIGDRFLQDGLTIRGGATTLTSLTPYFTTSEISRGLDEFFENKRNVKKTIKTLKRAKRYAPLVEPWPGFKTIIRALDRHDKEAVMEQVVPTMNAVLLLMVRARDILRQQFRTDLFPKRFRNKDYPGRHLELLLTHILKQVPPRFDHPSELKILASNALISLHVVKSIASITGMPQFKEYYQQNLFTQDELLKTALEWNPLEEKIIRLTAGNAKADQERRGYLSALALVNLITLEKNPEIRKHYETLLSSWWEDYQNEDNPMAMAFQRKNIGLILRDLDLYPEDRRGFGPDYWSANGKSIAEAHGGGEYKGYSREALPVHLRPKDSFLWQRNARRLQGDWVRDYPPTDYLFVYWYCRYHKIIPGAPVEPTVQSR